MVNLYFWYSDKSMKWYRCQNGEDEAIRKAKKGFDVRKVTYKSMPTAYRPHLPKSSRKKKRKHGRRKRSQRWY